MLHHLECMVFHILVVKWIVFALLYSMIERLWWLYKTKKNRAHASNI